MRLERRRAEGGMLGYFYLGPFGVEHGDGIVVRFGRCWFALRVKAGRA